MPDFGQDLLRIGVFYDGNFFHHVSNYYHYAHPRRMRISIPGLHEFIRHHAGNVEGVDVRFCHIVDAHFFRGRLSAKEADARQKLYAERVFDDILMGEGVVTHYLPIRQRVEKGIDVWLALEAFELAIYKKFNVVVLIAGDSDFIPLARKVNSLGTRVMVLGWDFKYTDELGQERETTTSIHLLDEVTYPVMMPQIIDDKTRRDDPLIKNLFIEAKDRPAPLPPRINVPRTDIPAPVTVSEGAFTPDTNGNSAPVAELAEHVIGRFEGTVLTIKEGFGFIRCPEFPKNVFFHWTALTNKDFADLQAGQQVQFTAVEGERGPGAREIEAIENNP